MTFSQKVLNFIQPGQKVLDFGAGNGWFSRDALQREAKVTAVDQRAPSEPNQDIDWKTMDAKDFIESWPSGDQFDIIFSRNLIQFLDTDWLEEKGLPALKEHLTANGIIALQTFYRDPEPPFEKKVSSLFTMADLRRMLRPFDILFEEEFQHYAPDMNGIPRTFSITNSIAQKK